MSESNPAATPPKASTDPANWVDDHADALFSYALLHVGDRAVAEECVQETFVAALEARGRFRGDSTLRTWLIGILRHKLADLLRRRGREAAIADAGHGAEAVASMFEAHGTWRRPPASWGQAAADPAALPEQDDLRQALRTCLGKLPPAMGTAFCLREMQGLKTENICKVLETSPTNLWTLLHRARALLRACLEKNWFRTGSD